ncbi:Hypothetical Protein PANA_3150 [Pantoea ananatis LMG 20103]|uniref:Uncharacterized protein n=1 Tax=Pantoea ananatis (strain LMG 20103) TaxID=706191 RepID=D4GM49_PANAM|nr:Hypothetical Protein PANA_3150 [Pantoea ananatis LMG 20103]
MRAADGPSWQRVILGQPLTVRFTSGDGRSLAQPDNSIRQRGITPAAKGVIFTFQILNLALPLAQQCVVFLSRRIQLRLCKVAALRHDVDRYQLAVFLAQFFVLCGQLCHLRADGPVCAVQLPRQQPGSHQQHGKAGHCNGAHHAAAPFRHQPSSRPRRLSSP